MFRMALTAFKENRSFGRAGFTGGKILTTPCRSRSIDADDKRRHRIMQEFDFSNPNKGNMVSHLNHARGVSRDVTTNWQSGAVSARPRRSSGSWHRHVL